MPTPTPAGPFDVGDRTRIGNHFGQIVSTGPLTGGTNTAPIVLSVPGWVRQPEVGQTVRVSGVLGNTAANGIWVVQAVTATTLTLAGSTGNGAFQASAGSMVELKLHEPFKNSAGVPTDPDEVTILLKRPADDGTVVVHRWPVAGTGEFPIVKEEVGRFYVDYTWDTEGVWAWELRGTGDVEASTQGYIQVSKRYAA